MTKELKLHDKFAGWLVFIGCVAIIFTVIAFVYRSAILRPQLIKVEIQLKEDTISGRVADLYSRVQVDSLISQIRLKEDAFEDRETFLTDKKEWAKDYQDIIFYVGAFIVAIAGFFGYKSFREVKTDSQEIAKEATNAYLDENLKQEVKKAITRSYGEEHYNTTIERLKQDLINKKIFITKYTIKDEVVSIFNEWTILVSKEDSTIEQTEQTTHTEQEIEETHIPENEQPHDFDD